MRTEINAKLLLASKNSTTGDTLYTWLLTTPRIILPELLTHRIASRNTSSSRAVPSRKIRERVLLDPFIPRYIGESRKGMQTGPEMSGWRRSAAEWIWKTSRLPALAAVWGMEKLGVHKAIVNRLVEPYTWTQMLFSATEVSNFFWLRDHHMAEPHFGELARQMHFQADHARWYFDVLYGFVEPDSRYQVLQPGEWHLPFIDDVDREAFGVEELKKISAARCARTSYLLPENGQRSDWNRDLELFHRLAVREDGNDDPMHLSPLEHPAQAMSESVFEGNFKGFKQLRKELHGEAGPETNVK